MESPQDSLPERLTVVLKNVRAVREVYDYLAGGDIEKDLISAQQTLVRHLRQALQIPDGWKRPYFEDYIRLHPDKKWSVPSKETIALAVFLPSPVSEEVDVRDASVNLYVPPWKLRERFTDSLEPYVPKAKDWVYIRNAEPDEVLPECPMGKWIRYQDYAGSNGFDTARFFQAITETVGELLRLETEIDRLFERAKTTTVAVPPRQPAGQSRRGRKPR